MDEHGAMWARRRTTAAGAAILLAACRVPAPRPPAPLPPATVVLVSFDGFRADYLDRRLPLPAFARLEAAGVRARALVPSFPSKTFPNHWTLVTGLRPGHHGIVANAFWDPVRQAEFRILHSAAVRDASWYGGTPVWALAERAGIRTGTVFWPGSEAPVDGVRPSHWLRYDARLPDSARVDSVAAWLALPAAVRPRFVAMYVSVTDDAGHAVGPDAPATDSAIVEADRTLGRLLDRLDAMPGGDAVDVVVVSDHGMEQITPDHVVDLSRYTDTVGWTVAPSAPGVSPHGGTHGWDPASDQAMRGIFLAAGPQIHARGTIPAFDNVHVAPFLGALLGLTWPKGTTDGDRRVLAPLLEMQWLRARRRP